MRMKIINCNAHLGITTNNNAKHYYFPCLLFFSIFNILFPTVVLTPFRYSLIQTTWQGNTGLQQLHYRATSEQLLLPARTVRSVWSEDCPRRHMCPVATKHRELHQVASRFTTLGTPPHKTSKWKTFTSPSPPFLPLSHTHTTNFVVQLNTFLSIKAAWCLCGFQIYSYPTQRIPLLT